MDVLWVIIKVLEIYGILPKAVGPKKNGPRDVRSIQQERLHRRDLEEQIHQWLIFP